MKLTDNPDYDDLPVGPPPGSAAWVKKEAWDNLDSDRKIDIAYIAGRVYRSFILADIEAAYMEIIESDLDIEEELALYWLLDSKVRTAIKKVKL